LFTSEQIQERLKRFEDISEQLEQERNGNFENSFGFVRT